ncbi:MAG: S8 family serine peptidase [Polyangiaceae bacterium]
MRRRLPGLLLTLLVAGAASAAPSSPPRASRDALGMLRVLGDAADRELAPSSGSLGAVVAIPEGHTAAEYGIDEFSPGFGRMRTSARNILAFSAAHPELRVEVASPLHPLTDRITKHVRSGVANAAGVRGAGTIVGVADTGIDVTHADFRTKAGKSRVKWILDLAQPPLGLHADLEKKYGVTTSKGVRYGAVLSAADIDTMIASKAETLPRDITGHGTHVTGIAAGTAESRYSGVAPEADIVGVRLQRGGVDAIEADDLLLATKFVFDRADFEKEPAVINLSLGTDFGPHDGTLLWEQALASLVGADKPGHIIVAAVGNSGSIANPVHQSVYVSEGSTMRVPVRAVQPAANGRVQIWVTKNPNADLKIGLDGPDGTWIAPVARGEERADESDGHNAGVIHGSTKDNQTIPQASDSAIVVWSGAWPAGEYDVTLEGKGGVELYMQTFGDAATAVLPVSFTYGVRSGTVNLPADHPSIISVGCTTNRTRWRTVAGYELGPTIPLLDAVGGLPTSEVRDPIEGEVCYFSSAGPNALGVPKPEIAAPGGAVISAMSSQATPGEPRSIFTTESCPDLPRGGGQDKRCLQVDGTHAVSSGTSMSSPVVAGVAALLLEREPTLTQDKVSALLQAGAHRFRGPAPFQNQSSLGEVDVLGSLDALARMNDPKRALPVFAKSWASVSVDSVAADGSIPATVFLELRNAEDSGADLFETARLTAQVTIDGTPVASPPTITRRAPGLFVYKYNATGANGGRLATFGATFDGVPIVAPRSIPIAADSWRALYPTRAKGGCSVHESVIPGTPNVWGGMAAFAALGIALGVRRARRRRH